MSATVILTTHVATRREAWARQVVPTINPATDDALGLELKRPGARVWIKDLSAPQSNYATHEDTVVIAVGEPNSLPFVEAKQSRDVAFCLSYEESTKMLQQVANLAGELAEKRAVVSVLGARPSATARATATPFPASPARTSSELDFVDAALQHLDDLDSVIDAFKRGLRGRLRSAKVAIFLRDERRFVAKAEGWECPVTDPLVEWLQGHGAIVNAEILGEIEEPLMVALVRQKLAVWNTRLLVPIDVRGKLTGWVSFGPRADARPYSQADDEDALMVVSLLAGLIAQHNELQTAHAAAADAKLLNTHGPKYRLVRSGETIPEGLELEAREVLGLARRASKRVEREFGDLRVSAGPVAGTAADFWVLVDPEGGTEGAMLRRLEVERFRILHDLGLILQHELSNALFSVSTLFQHQKKQSLQEMPPGLAELQKRVELDMIRLKEMPHILDTIYEMTKRPTELVDMRRLLSVVAKDVEGMALFSDAVITLCGHEENLRQALVWLCREIKANRDPSKEWPEEKIKLRLDERQRGEDKICLVFITYAGLQLDQIKTGAAETVSEFPTTSVYLAREVIRYHHGTIHVGQGVDGPELYVSLRSRQPVSTLPIEAGRETPIETATQPRAAAIR